MAGFIFILIYNDFKLNFSFTLACFNGVEQLVNGSTIRLAVDNRRLSNGRLMAGWTRI